MAWGLKFLRVRQHQIHVLVEGQERAYQCSTVRNGDPHAIIDVGQHFGTLGHGHGGDGSRRPRAFALAGRALSPRALRWTAAALSPRARAAKLG